MFMFDWSVPMNILPALLIIRTKIITSLSFRKKNSCSRTNQRRESVSPDICWLHRGDHLPAPGERYFSDDVFLYITRSRVASTRTTSVRYFAS